MEKEQLYIVEGMNPGRTGRAHIHTGAIRGEVEANNYRKFMQTQMPNLYWRMRPTTIEEAFSYQLPIDNLLIKAGRK